MNIFIDYVGHDDLEHSLYLLLAKRMGAAVYHPRPTQDWIDSGVYTCEMTHRLANVMPKGNSEVYGHQNRTLLSDENGLREYHLTDYGSTYADISLELFKNMKFDLVIVTSHENETAFANLVKSYKPTTKFVRVMANALEPPASARIYSGLRRCLCQASSMFATLYPSMT